jgi:hypothetical protein
MWAESVVCSSGQSDLRRTLAGEGVYEEKGIPVEGGRCIRCQCRCGGGRLDKSTDQNSVMRKGRGIEHYLLLGSRNVVGKLTLHIMQKPQNKNPL